MFTMALQLLVTSLLLAFGVLGLAIARNDTFQKPFQRVFWALAGAAFVTHGTAQGVQNLWGLWAMVEGGSSATMGHYLRWVPAFNHSRTFLWLAFSGVMVWFARRSTLPGRRAWGVALGALGAGLAAGAALGFAEGTLVAESHYTRVALWDAFELVVMLGVLFVSLLSGRLDRYLWAGLAVFAVMVAINIVWYAAMSMIEDRRVWSPAPWLMSAFRIVPTSLMVALAVRRLQLARRGTRVEALLQAQQARPTLTMG